VHLTVNGRAAEGTVEVRKTLADFIREDLGLTGTHLGCEHGVCGACTVLLNGASVKSCTVFAVQADQGEVLTVEGLAENDKLHPIQQAFADHHGLQCGYCTPGMLLAAQDLLRHGGVPSREQIREHLSGNYCRCTGYHAIVDAIEAVAQSRAGGRR